jgi:glycosyltransferase involved in cell wall biosynthesis
MLFSIVIPAHNGGRYLHQTIASAINQKRKADEVLVVDDASSDNTAEIAQSSEWKGQVLYFHNDKATGFVDAWNRAINKATGDFVSILHQDDLLHPDYLYHVEKSLKIYPDVQHIYTTCNYIDEQGNIINTPPRPHSTEPVYYSGKEYANNYLDGLIYNTHIHRCPGVTTGRKLLLDKCTFRSKAGHIADDDFFLRVGAFTVVLGISQPLASFRIHSASTTGKTEQLALQLAKCYIFQSNYYKNNSSLLGDRVIYLYKYAVKYINLLFFQALVFERQDWVDEALKLHLDFNRILPSFFKGNLPYWAKPLWTKDYRTARIGIVLRYYAKLLHKFIGLKNLFLKKV